MKYMSVHKLVGAMQRRLRGVQRQTAACSEGSSDTTDGQLLYSGGLHAGELPRVARSGGHGPVGRSGGPSSSTTWSSFCSAPTTHATRRCCWATPPRDSSTITRSSSAWCSAACGSAALRPAAERPAARRLAPCSLGLCALWPCVLRLNALRSLRPSGLRFGTLHAAELPRLGGLRLSTCGCAPAAHPAAACPATVRFAALHPQLSALRPCGGRLCTLRLSALRPDGLRLSTGW
jgi:hypothetical protein